MAQTRQRHKNDNSHEDTTKMDTINLRTNPVRSAHATNTNLLTAGSPIKWEQPVRFRQMTTRKYLLLDDNFQPSITDDGMDPKTVFRIHSLSQVGNFI